MTPHGAPSPDCSVGKHGSCAGDAWDDANDELCPCPCACHLEPEACSCCGGTIADDGACSDCSCGST